MKAEKDKFYPAMPMLAAGCFVGIWNHSSFRSNISLIGLSLSRIFLYRPALEFRFFQNLSGFFGHDSQNRIMDYYHSSLAAIT